jgi:hypothetical protein
MLGTYSVEDSVIRFEPQFALESGLIYRAVFRPDQLLGGGRGENSISSVFRIERKGAKPTTTVSHVYPSADVVPENLLKFYIHFSAPMSRGQIYDHIHLLEESGKEVDLPFLQIDEELWDPAMTRLTLFIDPGRIKRGVRPLEEVGPALEAGKQYTLIIDRAWKDGAGNPLLEPFRKEFKVGPPDREPPDPARWEIRPPKPGTREPLSIIFPESMDQALARRVIRVLNGAGRPVEGEVSLLDDERHWTFIPSSAWRAASYEIMIQTTIEDLAGNSIGKPFEVDLFEGIERRTQAPTMKLPFNVR